MQKENKARYTKHISFLMLIMLTSPVFAEVEKVVKNANSWLIDALGPTVIILAMVLAGIYMAVGNKLGLYRSMWAVVGGIIITSAKTIVEMIQGWAN